jgi:hypothetical protein
MSRQGLYYEDVRYATNWQHALPIAIKRCKESRFNATMMPSLFGAMWFLLKGIKK